MTPLFLHDHHAAAGAHFGTLVGEPVVQSYGDSAAEYLALIRGTGVIERADRAFIRLWGRDPVRMLNGLITNDLKTLERDRAIFGAMLTPKGKIISEVRVLAWPEPSSTELLVEIPHAALDAVRAHLQRYVPPLFARWEALEGTLGMLGLLGPGAAGVLRELLQSDLPAGEDGIVHASWEDTPVAIVGTETTGPPTGYDLIAPVPVLTSLWAALFGPPGDDRVRPIGFSIFEAARIEAGRPRFGLDFTEETMPAEVFETTGQMARALSFQKGCYTGQEVVVRIAHRGRVNRLLRGLRLGTHSPAEGTPLLETESGKSVGWITSVAHSPRLGEVIALAMLRRELGPGDVVALGEATGPRAEVHALPFFGSGNPE